MIFLSYTVSKITLAALHLLLLIPILMALFSIFAIIKMKAIGDKHFASEDEKIEALSQDKEPEDDLSYWYNNAKPKS